ncbi:hypothetical protein OCZ60_01225 [Proteus mirabilis]|uniref:hypothetical protein n=1 Tax=Proteus mirabilis TaxID=584 RepID=UPI0021DA7CBC|nr:hypothetical protein [Proteus mirabilis]MCU9603032.1 hypothetical protein [Proteus mirabilis]MDF7365700.1 hypothetical protein [Proteus mirabilis]
MSEDNNKNTPNTMTSDIGKIFKDISAQINEQTKMINALNDANASLRANMLLSFRISNLLLNSVLSKEEKDAAYNSLYNSINKGENDILELRQLEHLNLIFGRGDS